MSDSEFLLCRTAGCTLDATIVGTWSHTNSHQYGKKVAYCDRHAENWIQTNWLTDTEPLVDYLDNLFNEETWN